MSEEFRATTAVNPFQGSRYNKTNTVNLRRLDVGPPAWEALVAQFAMRYANAGTRRYYERDLKALFGFAGVDHPGSRASRLPDRDGAPCPSGRRCPPPGGRTRP